MLDFEDYGPEQLSLMVENVRGLMAQVMTTQAADIGLWSDDHPLNRRDTAQAEFNRLFPTPKEPA